MQIVSYSARAHRKSALILVVKAKDILRRGVAKYIGREKKILKIDVHFCIKNGKKKK